jgi:hypothetical protein
MCDYSSFICEWSRKINNDAKLYAESGRVGLHWQIWEDPGQVVAILTEGSRGFPKYL